MLNFFAEPRMTYVRGEELGENKAWRRERSGQKGATAVLENRLTYIGEPRSAASKGRTAS
jgi:hypothetical protein